MCVLVCCVCAYAPPRGSQRGARVVGLDWRSNTSSRSGNTRVFSCLFFLVSSPFPCRSVGRMVFSTRDFTKVTGRNSWLAPFCFLASLASAALPPCQERETRSESIIHVVAGSVSGVVVLCGCGLVNKRCVTCRDWTDGVEGWLVAA